MVQVSVNVILPERATTMIGMDAKGESTFKTLYLLHGLSDDHSIWMRRTAIERYASEYNIAVVMPAVGRSWYTDTAYGANYFSFITRELPELYFRTFSQMSRKREDNILAGLSMGGFHAMQISKHYPKMFDYVGLFSAAIFRGEEGVATYDDLEAKLEKYSIDIAILTLPKEYAEDVAARLEKTNIRGIWNFTGKEIQVGKDCILENVHIGDSLMTLCYEVAQKMYASDGKE
jgi:pimeloyl-ACP methyl ester carboxylesterase